MPKIGVEQVGFNGLQIGRTEKCQGIYDTLLLYLSTRIFKRAAVKVIAGLIRKRVV